MTVLNAPSVIPPISPQAGALKLYSFAEFKELAEAERTGWLWEGVLPTSGVVIFAGHPFAGKTVLLSILIGAASSEDENVAVVAGRTVARARVLYASLEHNLKPLAEHLEKAARTHGAEAPDVLLMTELSIDDEVTLAEIARRADEQDVDVIVVDSLRRATVAQENSADDVGSMAKRLRPLVGNGKRLVILVHHLSHDHRIRGSTDLSAQVDSTVIVERRGAISRITATHHHAPDISFTYAVEMNDTVLRAVPAGTSGTPADEGELGRRIEAAILRALDGGARHGTRALREAVARAVNGAAHDEVDRARDRLAAAGRIRNEGTRSRHAWVAVTPAPSAPVPASGSSGTGGPNEVPS